MLRYETLYLAVPELTADEASAIENALEKTVQEHQGKLLSHDRWGKYRLAYPIRNNEYGIYFLARYEVPQDKNFDLNESLKNLFQVRQTELVMRNVVVKLDSAASLEYTRPESLEEVPTRDVDTFLKENKMTGLLNKSHAGHTSDDADDVEDELSTDDNE